MKVVFLAVLAFYIFQLAYNCSDEEDELHEGRNWPRKSQVGINYKDQIISFVRNVVIPLLDVGVLWAEDNLVRNKRNPGQQATKKSLGFINSLIQHVKDKDNQIDTSDAFVDSLVSMMSKSDPELLLKLRKKIEEFEVQHRPRNYKKQEKQRPLIQFFNVTRISVSSSDEDDDTKIITGENSSLPKKGDSVILGGKKHRKKDDFFVDEYSKIKNGIEPKVLNLEINQKPDMSTYLKTKDGQIARIQRSKDRRRYRLEIDYTSEATQKVIKNNNCIDEWNHSNVSNLTMKKI